VVGYSGNLGRAHDTDTFVSAIELVEQRQSETVAVGTTIGDPPGVAQPGPSPPPAQLEMAHPVKWLFVGGGAQFERLKQEVVKRDLTSVVFAPYQPRERLSESLSAPDIHLISLRPELEGLIVPSKYYGIASAGRSAIFIGDADGEIARILTKSETGAVVPQGDGKALAETILNMVQNPKLVAERGRRARELFEKEFDWPDALARWRRLFDDLADLGQGQRTTKSNFTTGRSFAPAWGSDASSSSASRAPIERREEQQSRERHWP